MLKLRTTYKGSDDLQVAKVYHNTDWKEFQVKFWSHGEYQAGADYHTDDYGDALRTAAAYTSYICSPTTSKETP